MLDPVVEFLAAFDHDDRVRPRVRHSVSAATRRHGWRLCRGSRCGGHGQRSRRDNEAIAADRGVLEAVGAMLGHEPF